MSAQRRSDNAKIVKEFGIIETSPGRPLKKRDILARYNAIKGLDNHTVKGCNKDSLPCNNKVLTEKRIAEKIAEEIQDLYQNIGLRTIVFKQICAKVLSQKSDYYKSLKSAHAKSKFSPDVFVSFRAKKQPKETLKEDIEWYEAKLKGGPGSLGSKDSITHRREEERKRKKER